MKKLAVILLFSLITPNAYSADSGGSAPASTPAPVVATTPTPTPKYEVVTPTATSMPSVPTKNLTTDLTAIRSLIASKNFSSALASLKIADRIEEETQKALEGVIPEDGYDLGPAWDKIIKEIVA